MPGERTIMPNAARLRRGWRAGLRGRSAWLDTASGLAAVGLVLGAIPWSMASGFGARWQAALADPHHATVLLAEAAWGALALGAALATAFGLARILSAVFAGRLGPVDADARARLTAPASTQGTLALAVLTVMALVAMLLGVRGVLAAAVRSVDANPSGTLALWTQWPQRTWGVCLVVLAVVGWAELAISRRRNRARLAQSPEQVRDDRRARGGRR